MPCCGMASRERREISLQLNFCTIWKRNVNFIMLDYHMVLYNGVIGVSYSLSLLIYLFTYLLI